jgi:hypothetical protein
MSGKSRRRGRKLSRSQRKKVGRVSTAPVVETAAPTAQKPTPAPAPTAPTPVAAKAPPPRAVAMPEPPHIAGELKRIGVVGGIMVVLLVVAYFVLPLIL